MLYLVQGRSGTGKTRYVRNILADLAENGETKLLYLIPEQNSFDSETAFLRLLGPKLSRNIHVMSFTRLYDMVMRMTGSPSGTPIDDGIRKIMMSLALEDCIDQLDIYKRQAAKPQITDLMLSAVKEFKTCGISTEELREKARLTKGTDLSKKLKEVALVTDVYNALISESYIDPLDNNARLEKRLSEIHFFDGYTVVVDGFSGFTSQEQKILDLIMEQSKDFYITLCMEATNEMELFATVIRTKKRIIQSAGRMGIKVASPISLTENFRTDNKALLCAECGIYRIDGKVYDQESEDVTLVMAGNIFEECDYISEQIQKLALGGVCRYRDIAVVCRNSENYRGILDSAFESHNIPFFMSKPQPIDTKPLMLLVLSALEYVINPSDSDKLFSIAKCGLLKLSDIEIAQLENYAYIWGLSGRKFTEAFTANPNGYNNTFTDTDNKKERLEKLNETRVTLIKPLEKFAKKLENSNAEKISSAIYDLLIDYNVPEKLKSDTAVTAYEEYSDEEIRIWDILMDILNKMYLSLGERPITVKRYYELIKMVIRSVDIADIPQTLDQVLVGTANSVRLSSPYAVFVIGAINGEFPHTPVASGIFSDSERRSLITLELPMYDAIEELFLQEKFLVYNAVSAPTNRLFVSYYTHSADGTLLKPSSIYTELDRLLPNAKKDTVSNKPDIEKIYCEKTAFEQCAKLFHEKSELSVALKEYFSAKEEYSAKLRAIDNASNQEQYRINDRNTCEALFGRDKTLSSSQIEKFYQCRFQYFCSYGLKLKERRKAQIGPLEFGNLVHYLLENVVQRYTENDDILLSDEDLSSLLDELLEKYISESLGGEEDKSSRFIHLYYRLKDNTQMLLKHLTEELQQSEFKPVDFELNIGGDDGINAYCIEDSNGNTVRVKGVIDRVDVMKTQHESCIRIVDYKTGSKAFRIADVLEGLNMQMLIYLSAITQNGKERYGENIRPCGIMYMPATVNDVTVDPHAKDDDIETEHNTNLRMSGIVLNEEHIIRGMESNLDGKYIGVSKKKDGSFTAASYDKLITNRQLNILFDKVEDKISEMSCELDKGNIGAKPCKPGNPCSWCIYGSICGKSDCTKSAVSAASNSDVLEILESKEAEKDCRE